MRLTRRATLAGATALLSGVGASAGRRTTEGVTMELLAEEQVDHEHACFHAEHDERTPLSAGGDPGTGPTASDTHVIWAVTVPGATGYVTFDAGAHFHDGPFVFYTADGSVVPVTGTLVEGAAVGDACPYLDEYAVVEPADGTITLALDPDDGPDPAVFDVSLAPPEAVTVGETAAVEYAVENTGEQAGTQTVAFLVEGEAVDSHEVSLAPDEVETGAFEYTTGPEDTPELPVAVASDDTTDPGTVAVTEPTLAVDILAAPDSVTAGETAAVEYAVENTGTEAVTETLTFLADGEAVDSREVSPAPGETETGVFEYTTGSADAPEVSLAVTGDEASATAAVAVTEPSPAAFAVSVVSYTPTVTAGEAAIVVYRVENTGEQTGSRTVEVLVDGDPVEDRQVTLDPGAETTDTVTYPTTAADTPEREIAVRSGDSEVAETVVVEAADPAAFAVSLDDREVTVEPASEFDLTATVTNSGEQAATREVSLELGGAERASESVSLDGGETETVTFAGIESPDPGEYEVVVDSGDSETTATLVVSDPVTGLELAVDGHPAAGEAVPFAVTATRASGATEDVTEDATVSVASGEVTVDGGVVEGVSPGPAELTATLDGVTATAEVEVAEPAAFAVDIGAADLTVAAGESVEVPVAVTNSGERAGEVTVTVDGDGFEAVTRHLSLDAGAQTEFVVSLDPADPEDGRTTVTATAGDDTDDLSVTVASESGGADDAGETPGAGADDAGETPGEGADDADGDGDTSDSADDDGPGFGPAVGLAGLGGLLGLLAQHDGGHDDNTT